MGKKNPSGPRANGPDRENTAKSQHDNRGPDGRFLSGTSGLPDEPPRPILALDPNLLISSQLAGHKLSPTANCDIWWHPGGK